AEIQDVLILGAINRALPVLRHLKSMENVHPADFYRDCLALAGDFATYLEPTREPNAYPPYQHHDLTSSFQPVVRDLRRYLSAAIETNAVSIPLDPRKYGISVGVIADRKLLNTADFFLSVSADLPAEKIRRHFAAQSKVGPVEEIRQLVNSALPGIELTPLPVAPRQVPYNANSVYFSVSGTSPYWAKMSTSGGIAVHVSGDYPGLEMELWAVRRG
ncbi:type VI secretion system baseplate subunit TssK, partial [Pseudooceanicola sp. C21-150M6]|uniref:type VI secretion system baseplate subunit TssK n=1 Tax=Pseudooceanicola sp. C21-150M6 TaxID=3434355 RepID=UPI003D7F9C4D